MSVLETVLDTLGQSKWPASTDCSNFCASTAIDRSGLQDELRKAAQWCAATFKDIGFAEAKVVPTSGHPMVVAHGQADRDPDMPHLLFYGHYDVQPPDPLELWETPPFEPRIKDAENGEQIVGRGVADDKGQLMTFVEASAPGRRSPASSHRDLHVLEGEEETGSPSLPDFLDEYARS